MYIRLVLDGETIIKDIYNEESLQKIANTLETRELEKDAYMRYDPILKEYQILTLSKRN